MPALKAIPGGRNSSNPIDLKIIELLESQQIHLARLQNRLSIRQIRIVRAALAEMVAEADALKHGNASKWTQARATAVTLLLARGLKQLVGDQKQILTKDLGLVSRQSQKDAVLYLSALDKHFNGSVTPLNFDSLKWWESTNRDIGRMRIEQYEKSWNRYGYTMSNKIREEIAKNVLIGESWQNVRPKIQEITKDVVKGEQYRVDTLIRTETSAVWNGTQLMAMQAEDSKEDPMLKKLVAHFDAVTGRDSVRLHGQTRPVKKPFYDSFNGITYQAPPNRPNDREIMVGWRSSYGNHFPKYDEETAEGYDPEIHGSLTKAKPVTEEEKQQAKRARMQQIKTLRRKRDQVQESLKRAKQRLARIEAMKKRSDTDELREQYMTQARLVTILTVQLEEHRQWLAGLRAKMPIRYQ